MRSAHPIKDKAGAPGTGAAIVALGKLPVHKNTACAEVLSRIMNGEVMDGMGAVFGASTTRLAAHIGYLEAKYGWRFERREKVNGCKDGRVVTVMTYFLTSADAERALTEGGACWCTDVRVARRALRAKAHAKAIRLARSVTGLPAPCAPSKAASP